MLSGVHILLHDSPWACPVLVVTPHHQSPPRYCMGFSEHLSHHKFPEVPPFLPLCVLTEHRGIPGEASFITVGKMGHAACMRAREGKHELRVPLVHGSCRRLHACIGVSMHILQASLYSCVRLNMVVFSAFTCPNEVPEELWGLVFMWLLTGRQPIFNLVKDIAYVWSLFLHIKATHKK